MPDPGGAPVALKATRLTRGAPANPPHLPRATVDRRRIVEPIAAEMLAARAEWLPQDERDLIVAVYRHARPVRAMARAAGVPSYVVYKRIGRLVRRLTHRHYAYVVTHQHLWCRDVRNVAVVCILHGRTLHEAVRSLRLSYHTVRRWRDLVLRMADAAHTASVGASAKRAVTEERGNS